VIGIVASRIAERHHRPCVLVALDGDRGTGSGRSIPPYDLLAGLDASSAHLQRHGGHRAAAGCDVRREDVPAFRAAFEAHAAATLAPEDLVPVERVDAVVAGDELGLDLAEELGVLAPFGTANPSVSLLVPAARLSDPRPMGEGRHVRFTVSSGGRRAQAVAFGVTKVDCDGPVDATFALEVNEYNGAVSPRLVLRHARPCEPQPIELVGEPRDFVGAALDEARRPSAQPLAGLHLADPLAPLPHTGHELRIRDRRQGGIAGTLAAMVHAGAPVLAVAADAIVRARQLRPILGGFRLCSHVALAADPVLAAGAHVVVLDPPADPERLTDLLSSPPGQMVHLAWGAPEVDFALRIHEREYGLRATLAAVYRALRELGSAEGESLEEALRGDPASPRTAASAGRALRVLEELHLVRLDREARRVTVPRAQRRTSLDESASYREYQVILDRGTRWLTRSTAQAA
jgi:single-stranded-DNA-specific exonuclease